MELIIDANEVISALISFSGKTAEIIFSDKIKLFSPEYLLEEIDRHKDEILKKSELTTEDLEVLLNLISLNIEFISFSEFEEFEEESSKISADPNDVEYLALALKLNCTLWSEDKALKDNGRVNVLTTSDLLEILKL